MKIGAIGFGSRTAHVYHEFSKVNSNCQMVAYVDPDPIGKDYAEKYNFFPTTNYSSLKDMLNNEKLDLLMVGSPNHLHLEHIKEGLESGLKIFAEKPIVINEDQTFELAKLIKKFGKDKIIVGLVLRYSQQARTVRDLLEKNKIGEVISIEGSEHIVPSHGAFFMRNWRRKEKYSGGFMLEKCCHDIDFYSMITNSRPIKLASFGSRRSFIPKNLPNGSLDEYTKDRLRGWESKTNVFDSDADIVDHQVAIIEYENKAVLSFHTNMKVPDEYRRFAIMGTKGMIEGDFVRGFLKAHDENNNLILDENYGSAFGQEIKGHYGADSMMAKDINSHLISDNFNLPVGVVECMEAGIVAMKLDESIKTNSIIDLTSTWNELDNLLNK